MENLNHLLKEISILNQRIQDRERNEDRFNIFDVMFKPSDEVNLHSRFLSFMLNSDGSHKLKDTFLRLFLHQVGIPFKYDVDELETYPNEMDKKEHKEIDILLIDRRNRQALIIENKIFAPDSNHENEGQLERYYRIIQEEGIPADNIHIIYLSLDRESPSEESVSKSGLFPELKDKVRCIHYGVDILAWLNKCVNECYANQMVKETVRQYIKLVQKMTNNTATEEDIKSLMSIVGENRSNLSSAKLIVDNYVHLHWWSIYEFWKLLSESLVSQGYHIDKRIENEEIDNLVHGSSRVNKVDFFLKVTTPSGLPLTVACYYDSCLCFGIETHDAKDSWTKDCLSELKRKENELLLENCDGWEICKFIDFEGNKRLRFSDFGEEPTFNLISKGKRQEYVNKIISHIDSLFAYLQT